MISSALVRSNIESALRHRIPAALTPASKNKNSSLPTGVLQLDRAIENGVPEGALTEISGSTSSGKTTLFLSLLKQCTRAGRCCALVDVADAFHPRSAEESGAVLSRLLWVRCGRSTNSYDAVAKALRVTDLLLQAGGFGMVALDLGEESQQVVRRIPLATWFRFRKAIENTPTAFIVMDQVPVTGTCASLVMRMAQENPDSGWNCSPRTHATLMQNSSIHVEAALKRKPVQSVSFQAKNSFSL
jgi:hypothetical protein